MGWFSSGKPDPKPAKRIRVSDIAYGHTPDKRGKRTDKWGREPIDVKRTWLGGYKVIDGNDRLFYAKRDGKTHIDARVWD